MHEKCGIVLQGKKCRKEKFDTFVWKNARKKKRHNIAWMENVRNDCRGSKYGKSDVGLSSAMSEL